MKPVTNVQDWQLAANDISHPMYNMWKIDMQRSVLQNTLWVEQPENRNLVTLESWKRYRYQASQPNFVNWATSPDPDFNELYKHRSIALETLYTHVHMMLSTFSYDPFIADIYREKTEQAIQYISNIQVGNDIPCPALIAIELNEYPTVEQALEVCNTIIARRTNWVTKISLIEKIRLDTKRLILTLPNYIDVNKQTQLAVKHLNDLYKKWI